jgi:Flp pilus assembly protein TadG
MLRLRSRSRTSERTDGRAPGQIIVIFGAAMVLFTLLSATVIDLSWYWTNNLRMQRAADAAALAGVVFLPGDPTSAFAAARAEATKNGYTAGTGGISSVTPTVDPANNRRLRVSITGSVSTYFARVVGLAAFPARRDAKAEYVLPVPMGSPENYYGVFGKLRTPDGGTTVVERGNTVYFDPTSQPGGNWTNPANANIQDATTPPTSYATKATNTNPYQLWGGFPTALPSGSPVIEGIEVEVIARSTDTAGCQLRAALNWTGTSNVTSSNMSSSRTVDLNGTFRALQFGGATDTWGRTWSASDIAQANLRVRIEYLDPDAGNTCTNGAEAQVDHVHVRIHWRKSTFVPDANLAGPTGQALTPRGFWGTMLTQGADDVNGDAYLPANEQGSGDSNPEYAPTRYYDYAVEMPATVGGSIHVFDPVFCATNGNGQYGTGDRYFGGSASAVSSFFELYDTHNTPYDLSDDTRVDPTSDVGLFRGIQASDETLDGPDVEGATQDCSSGATSNPGDGRYWHNRWWPLATGLTGGTTYRVRTRTTDPANSGAQSGANGENSFALWASGGKIYGIGAMQAFSPLPGSETSEFYLAQIDAAHAGKTVVISLWDPGDTGSLTGDLRIRIPGSGGYTSASLTWRAQKGTTNSNASSCNGSTGSGTSIATHNNGSQRFNGCWLTIEIPIPVTYTAPAPPGEAEAGWWKIQYVMTGDAADTSFDVTTWQVAIRGNPVHLVLP